MKRQILNNLSKALIILLCTLFSAGIIQAQETKSLWTETDRASEEEAIKNTIIGQTTAFTNRDSIGYVNSFSNDAITQTVYNYADGTYGVFKGMTSVQEKISASLKANPNKIYESKVERTGWLIKSLSPEWSWVNYTQKMSNVKGEIFTSYESRLMNKIGGKWKIVIINALWDYKNVEKAVAMDRTLDEKAIMATIQNETDCFYARDYACWKDNYVHGNHVFQGWSNDNGTFDTKVGWEKVNAKIEKYIKENKAPIAANRKVERRNMQYTFYGDMACYMTWDQYQEEKTGKNYMHSHEIRLMEKHNGQWKIACVAAFWDYKNFTPIAALKP